MPKYRVSLDSTTFDFDVKLKEPNPNYHYPIVGILDTGIERNSYLAPWLVQDSFSSYPSDLIDTAHGSSVASILLYGDELEGANYVGLEGCYLYDATVYPDSSKESIDEDMLIANIRSAIAGKKDEIKIWNLSLGTAAEADVSTFSDFGIALDNIQEINDVIICKSTGNCKNFLRNIPKSRIAKSADSIRSLVIGSIAHKQSNGDLAKINHPSPFTRIGRGPGNIIKPELVSYGGNAGVKNGRLYDSGVNALDKNGTPVTISGTSFATPRVTALLSSLFFNLNEEFNPLLLKALAIHSAKYPEGLGMSLPERIKQMGFGLPGISEDIIYNDPYEITLILQDTLVKGEFMEILDFPFPEMLVDDGYFYGNIKATLVSAPVLRENQGSEYCQSNVDLFFGTYDKEKERDISKNNILNEFGPDGAKNLLRDANYRAKYKKDHVSKFATERMLVNYGRKYQPIKKYMVDLEEMTPSNKENYLKTPKKWYLKIKGLYRDFAESMALVDGEQLSQEICLILTIKDNKRQFPVYDHVTQLLDIRNFVHSNIKLRQEIRIDIE